MAFYFLIADFPEEAKWLTPEEKAFVKARLEEDVGQSGIDTQIDPKIIVKTLRDCKLYLFKGSLYLMKGFCLTYSCCRQNNLGRLHVFRTNRTGL